MQRSIRFPVELDEKIAKLAEADDRSFSYVVLRTLESALGGQGSGDTRSVTSPRESGSVKEVRATESPAQSRTSRPKPPAVPGVVAGSDLKKVCDRGCEVPVTTAIKRCVTHGLPLK